MIKIRNYFRRNPNIALSITTVMCFIQFTDSLFTSYRSGIFDDNTIASLLASADGFETVILFLIMLVLKDKDK